MAHADAPRAGTPVVADPAAVLALETITVLPIGLSSRYQVDDRDELERNVYKMLLRELSLKGYVLDKPRKWTPPDDWSAEALVALSPAELAGLAPKHASHVMMLLVENVDESNQVVKSSATTTVSATLLETAGARVLWHKRGEGKFDENLLSGWIVMAITRDKYFALEKAFANLFENFPEKPTD